MIRYGRIRVVVPLHSFFLLRNCSHLIFLSFDLLSENILLALLFSSSSLYSPLQSTKYFTSYLSLYCFFLLLRLPCRSKFGSKVNPSRWYAKIIELVSPTRNLSGGLPNLFPSAHNSLSILRNPFMPVIMRGFAPYPYT